MFDGSHEKHPIHDLLKDPRARDLLSPRDLKISDVDEEPGWKLPAFLGRLGEISGAHNSASLTLAFRLIREAQRSGEPVVWIARKESIFYPPDAADLSVDVEAIIVVWAARPNLALKAADQLIRSGGFGLVIADLGPNARLPLASLSRLASLVKKHRAALVFLTEKRSERDSLGSLVSIRVQTKRTRLGEDQFLCQAHAVKDKRLGPGWIHEEVGHGPDGLR